MAYPGKHHLQIQLWIYRLLFEMNLYQSIVKEKEFKDNFVARILGFADIVDRTDGEASLDREAIFSRMRKKWRAVEQEYALRPQHTDLFRAALNLGTKIGLSEIEREIVGFRLEAERRGLRNVISNISQLTRDTLYELLSVCLARDENEIRLALAPSGMLVRSGIVELRLHSGWNFLDAFDLLSCLKEEIFNERDDPLAYFSDRLIRASPPRLGFTDYPHVAKDIEVLTNYLADATNARRVGVNILIHGKPGTGKSEFVRMIAAKLGLGLLEVASSDRRGQAMSGEERFRAYRLGQTLLEKSPTYLMLFDEIEDVFKQATITPEVAAHQKQQKAWINRIMEINPVPTFWVTNDVRSIDRAFLRRFDYVVAMEIPPRSIRRRILDLYLKDLPISDRWVRQMAEHDGLVPAIVERAAKVVRPLSKNAEPEDVQSALTRVLGNTLEVMGELRWPRSPVIHEAYRLDILNTDCDLFQVREQLKIHRKGRICLFGPPGTGKSALGIHLAEVLDLPLILKRASDIVSPWVGMTERHIAEMFRQAGEEGAILLLDEADSFLLDRQNARNSWEVTEVNEMLTQMEAFDGIFIATTNLILSLDPATLRRFDLKIRFDYLTSNQALALFEDARKQLDITDGVDMSALVSRLDCLTPGDFASVMRQAKLRPISSSMELFQRLRAECVLKPNGKKRTIGFAA